MTEKVTLERGLPSQRATLDALAQLYIHDFNDFVRPQRLEVGEDGRFADEMGLEDYWTKPDHSVWFIRADGRLAGFALLDNKTRLEAPPDFNMAQFFVSRAYRGLDVAGRAVEQILNMHPGRWEIGITNQNTPALRFWPKAVERAQIAGLEIRDLSTRNGMRTVLRFNVLPAQTG